MFIAVIADVIAHDPPPTLPNLTLSPSMLTPTALHLTSQKRGKIKMKSESGWAKVKRLEPSKQKKVDLFVYGI